MTTLSSRFSSEINLINHYLNNVIPENQELPELNEMAKACRYSLLLSGKRFRAVLTLLTARALGCEFNLVLPYAAAVEIIHTYSLIHDDLPCMDDDDLRRGQASHHKVFGEAMAVITGDALQAFAFEMIANHYQKTPALALQTIALLAKASGYQGMVGGQAIDLRVGEGQSTNLETLKILHQLKTGKLIQASTEGAAILCRASTAEIKLFSDFGADLGLAFQVADDILDHNEDKPELMGLPKYLGIEKTHQYLDQLTEQCLAKLKVFGESANDLSFIVNFNKNRLA